MADIRAAASGDFSATATWIGGVVPGSGDVAYANSFTVTVSDTRTVQAISNAAAGSPVATVGGTFSLLNNCNLTCTNANGVVQGATTTSCVTTPGLALGQTATLTANITGTTSNTTITFNAAGTLNVIGNLSAISNVGLISITGAGILNTTGNITGGTGSFAYGVQINNAGATINHTGNVTGGTGGTAHGILISSGTVAVTGNIFGANSGSGSGISVSAGTLTHNGACQAGTVTPAISSASSAATIRLSGPFLLSSNNLFPVVCPAWRWAPTQIPTYMEVPTSAGTTKRNLYTADNMPAGGYPVATNVRATVVYGPNSEFTGSLAVPAPSSVALGVSTDNTTGTAILTAANVRSAVGMASANLDAQLGPKATVDQVAAIVEAATSDTSPP